MFCSTTAIYNDLVHTIIISATWFGCCLKRSKFSKRYNLVSLTTYLSIAFKLNDKCVQYPLLLYNSFESFIFWLLFYSAGCHVENVSSLLVKKEQILPVRRCCVFGLRQAYNPCFWRRCLGLLLTQGSYCVIDNMKRWLNVNSVL